MNAKCPKCGTDTFQHWNLGHMHKCHVCGTVFKTE
jgi:rubredoxin